MANEVRRYTVDDLESFPDDGKRYELLDGRLLVTPASLPAHDLVVLRIRDALIAYLAKRGLVFSHGVVQIRPGNHLEPDILVLSATQRLGKTWADIKGFWLAVEVSSRDSRVYDRDFKHHAYAALGVREAWRVDMLDQHVSVLRADDETTVVDETTIVDWLTWHPPEMPAPLRIHVPSLFDGVEEDL